MRIQIYQLTLAFLVSLFVGGCDQPEYTQAQQKDIIDAVFANGELIPEDVYLVTAKAESYLLESFVDEGDTVKKGMPLFVLSNESQAAQLTNAEANYLDAKRKLDADAPQIRQQELQIEQAKIQLSTDEANLGRYEKLAKSGAVSQVELEKIKLQYEASKSNLEILEQSLDELLSNSRLNLSNAETQLVLQKETNQDFFLSSAISGKVLNVYKTNGDLIRRGESVAEIGGGDILLKLYIAEEDINRIKQGQELLVALNTEPGRLYKAVVSKMYPAFDTQEQSFVIEALFVEHPLYLFPYTQVQANIIVSENKGALVIPTSSLVDGRYVILEDGNQKEITIGLQTPEWTEVLEGLVDAQKIILPESK